MSRARHFGTCRFCGRYLSTGCLPDPCPDMLARGYKPYEDGTTDSGKVDALVAIRGHQRPRGGPESER